MKRESVYDLARKATALLILGYEPRKGESIEDFVARCESELKKLALARDEKHAENIA